MGLQGTIPYATTLLNVASAYRVFGRLEESMGYYLQVQTLYHELLEPDSMFMAGLKNNMALLRRWILLKIQQFFMALLYQEMGDFAQAKRSLQEALSIVERKDAAYETGVSCANLASTCIQLEELEEARGYALRSMEVFRRANVMDNHYAAAQSAMGAYFFRKGDFGQAAEYYGQALATVEKCVGRNGFYDRLQENLQACRRAMGGPAQGKEGLGIRLAREYYEEYGREMIERDFPAYAGRIAVGLAGGGSDCFGYDDEASRDHDWGPDFCLWLTDETYDEIGEALQQAYEQLPEEFKGYRRAPRVNGRGRRGVIRISDFYRALVGTDDYDKIDWRQAGDAGLAASVNGTVFRDDEGIFSAFRRKLEAGYPEEIRYLKLAESAARFSQTLQYNYPRMLARGDMLSARMLAWEGVGEAMKLQHYIEGSIRPTRNGCIEACRNRKRAGRQPECWPMWLQGWQGGSLRIRMQPRRRGMAGKVKETPGRRIPSGGWRSILPWNCIGQGLSAIPRAIWTPTVRSWYTRPLWGQKAMRSWRRKSPDLSSRPSTR